MTKKKDPDEELNIPEDSEEHPGGVETTDPSIHEIKSEPWNPPEPDPQA